MDPDDGDNERIIGFDLEGYEATPPSDAEPPRLGDLPADFEVRYRPVVGIYDDESDELWYVVWAAARFQWVGPRAD
jgi:hypothetical protein